MQNPKPAILFICPAFFGYEVSITEALKANGYDVDFVDERTSNKSIYKAVFRIRKDLLTRQIDKYYQDVLKNISVKYYNWLFVIKGEVVPEWFIIKFKENNPQAKLVYYTYDSFKNNNKHSTHITKHFDKCFSFDFEDVRINPELKLKHLFYTSDYLLGETPFARKYNLSFVGTLHSNRYSVMKKIAGALSNSYIFYYMPAKWFFLFSKLTKKEYKPIKMAEVSFTKISKAQVASIFHSSKSVLDIQRFGQTGLTMRTFEVLASGCVLVTTNTCIKQADFYDPQRIVVLEDINDEKNIERIKQAIDSPAIFDTPIDPAFEKYFVNNWVKEFFE